MSRAMLERYGLVNPRPAACPAPGCGAQMRAPLSWLRQVPYWRCGPRGHRTSALTDTIFQSCHIKVGLALRIMLMWAAGARVGTAADVLNVHRNTVMMWYKRCRLCVGEVAGPAVELGGHGVEVEVDESEIGRRRKGVVGHPATNRCDVRGIFVRSTKELYIEVYDKVAAGPEHRRRFGPPTLPETRCLFQRIQPGSIVFTDSARAYKRAAQERHCFHASLNHKVGQFTKRVRILGRRRTAGTQGLDGTWGLLKAFLRDHGNPPTDLVPEYIGEFCWRRLVRRQRQDPFWALLQCPVSDGLWE